MKTDFSIYGKVQEEEVIEIVRSVMTTEGFKIVDEYEMNIENKKKDSFYRFVFDCNPLLQTELEKNGLLPNFPYLNLTIRSTSELKSEIKVDDPDLTMTDFQKKRFKPVIPLIEEYLDQALNGVMEY